MFQDIVKQKLLQRNQAELLRQRLVFERVSAARLEINNTKYINFSSNDYLAIGSDSLDIKSNMSGALASPLVTGRQRIHLELEQIILDWLGANANYGCLLFSSGYAANSGVLNALYDKNSSGLLFQDKLNHASLLEAGKNLQGLGACKQYRFKHNDIADLSMQLKKRTSTQSPSLVVTEGIFSMDGDQPDLQAMTKAAKKHSAWFMVDDAHGIGTVGNKGAGSLVQQGLTLEDCDILVIPFGKAIGAQGAAVVAKQEVIDYLVNFSKEYIYSTHLSPIQSQAVLNNIIKIQNESWRQQKLHDNIEQFKQGLCDSHYTLLDSHSGIQPIIVGEETRAMKLAHNLNQQGIWVNAMRYPTVAKNSARLRITITAGHSAQDIQKLTDCLLSSEGQS